MKKIIEAFVEYADAVASVRCWDIVDGRLLLVPVSPVDAAVFVNVAKANGLSARKQAASVYVTGFGRLANREAARIARAIDDVDSWIDRGGVSRRGGNVVARRLYDRAIALGLYADVAKLVTKNQKEKR